MTTLTKVGHSIIHQSEVFRDKICNDGHFCDDVAMMLLAGVTMWMMFEAMKPIM